MNKKKFVFLLTTFVVLVVIIIALTTALSSGGFKKDEAGYQYKMVWDKSSVKAKEGDMMIANFTTSNDRDSVFFSSYKKGEPIEIPVSKGYAFACLTRLGAGDSGLFRLSTDSLYKGFRPKYVREHSYITIGIKVDTVLDMKSFQQYKMGMNKRNSGKDDKVINDYLTSKGVTASKTASGLYYSITKEGTGRTAKEGDKVSVLYKGMLLNGNVFDASEMHGNEPFDFTIGNNEVIQGWDEGLTMFNKGAKGILYIPSALGYGSHAMGEAIPANSVLIFEIELKDIK